MKIAIIGFGFVGKALSNGIKETVDVLKIDPILGTNLNDLSSFNPEFTFICLPTPMDNDGSQDLSIINSVFRELEGLSLKTTYVLKSTVTPDNLELLSKRIDFVLNPEFLREKTANHDFINGEIILFGGDEKLCKKVSHFYNNFTFCKQKKHFITNIITASFVKYSINSFLATKVIFFNQLYSLYQASNQDADWQKFIEIVSMDKRIGSSHMNVPGHDGRKGFGGACFPKDISALKNYASKIGVDFSIINKTIRINNAIRSVYNEPIERESAQNISFEEEK